jgi:transaldolase
MNPLHIDLYADGAVIEEMLETKATGRVAGFTTNPTLMRKAGVSDYRGWARQVLQAIQDMPVSFEVLADDFPGMARQAREIASWGPNVFVKIPVTNGQGESSAPLVAELCAQGVQVNVTALLTLDQVRRVAEALNPAVPAIVSVFAGRIADTGRDPLPLMAEALRILESNPRARLLWASCRELLNLFQAQDCGCHIITVTPDILRKLPLVGMGLDALSLDTVRMFLRDAAAAGFSL